MNPPRFLPLAAALLLSSGLVIQPLCARDTETYILASVTKDYYVGKATVDQEGLLKLQADATWRHIGYVDTSVMQAAFDPRDRNVFYVAAENGCFRTLDGGKTWRITTSWDYTEPRDICVDQIAPDDVYLALPDGIALSGDRGQTWRRIETGLPPRGRYTQCLQTDRTRTGRVLAGCEHGIYLTEDRGSHWRRVLPANATVDDIRQSPSDAARWFAVTQSDGAWTSADGGGSWTRLEGVPGKKTLYNVSIAGSDSRRIAIGSWVYGVLASEDGGKTWSPRNAGLPAGHHVWRVGIDPQTGRLYASVWQEAIFTSDDFGRTWRRSGFECARINSFSFVTALGDHR